MNMTDFDLRTAMRLSSLLIGMMSVVLFLLRNSYPPYVRGVTEWASALCTLFVACALLSVRGILPDFHQRGESARPDVRGQKTDNPVSAFSVE